MWSVPRHAEFSSWTESFRGDLRRRTKLDFNSAEPFDLSLLIILSGAKAFGISDIQTFKANSNFGAPTNAARLSQCYIRMGGTRMLHRPDATGRRSTCLHLALLIGSTWITSGLPTAHELARLLVTESF